MFVLTTFDKVKGIIIEALGCEDEDVISDASLVDDLGADSLDIVEIAMVLEEEFGLEIPDEAAGRLKTVNNIVQYVDNYS